MNITLKDLKAIKADLAKLRPVRLTVDNERPLSLKKSVITLAPELCRMKKRGFTTVEIVAALKGHGLHVKGATLNRYLKENQTATKGTNTAGSLQNRRTTKRTDQGITNSYTPESRDAIAASTPNERPALREGEENLA
jgi:hypothetical protein